MCSYIPCADYSYPHCWHAVIAHHRRVGTPYLDVQLRMSSKLRRYLDVARTIEYTKMTCTHVFTRGLRNHGLAHAARSRQE
jgi:hypothetical protein